VFSALLKHLEDNSSNLTPNLAEILGGRGFKVMPKAIGTKYSVKKCIPESYEQKEKP
jgi:hypothetical protein